MDPWLEGPAFWPDFHNSLIAAIRDALVPQVDPKYYVAIEERIVFWSANRPVAGGVADLIAGPRGNGPAVAAAAPADAPGVRVLDVATPIAVPIPETFLEIRDFGSREVVTVVEVLSPANKIHARGRRDYLKKRARLLESRTNLVEIDLLRAGRPMPLDDEPPRDHYRILISRAHRRPGARLFLFSCRVPIPVVPIPLLGDDETALDLTPILHQTIDRARYYRRIPYGESPGAPWDPADAAWAAAIIDRAV